MLPRGRNVSIVFGDGPLLGHECGQTPGSRTGQWPHRDDQQTGIRLRVGCV